MRISRILGTLSAATALFVGTIIAHADEVNCPICGMTLSSHEAKITTIYKGQTYYFMNAQMKAQFLKNPAKYAQSPINYKTTLVTQPEEIKPGVPVTLQVTLRDPGTHKSINKYRVVHEMPIHLIMASEDLSWFTHEHPTLDKNGTFTLKNFVFPHAGNYRLYGDVTPETGGHQIKMMDVTVIGEPPVPQPLRAEPVGVKTFGDYALTMKTDGPLMAGHMASISVHVEKNGQPVRDIKPWLGAASHMVGLSADGKMFVHAHPEGEPGPQNGPDITFHTTFTKPGVYKLWAQMSHEGGVRTFPFVVDVQGKQMAQAPREVFTCAVLGGKIDPATKTKHEFSDYKGARYYFCCAGCKPQFDASPAKYVKNTIGK